MRRQKIPMRNTCAYGSSFAFLLAQSRSDCSVRFGGSKSRFPILKTATNAVFSIFGSFFVSL
jgi:hypothetical protein